MAPLKSPGPDGFNFGFYQEYWLIIGQDVCLAALNFLNEGVFDYGINYAFIVLIPKIKNP